MGGTGRLGCEVQGECLGWVDGDGEGPCRPGCKGEEGSVSWEGRGGRWVSWEARRRRRQDVCTVRTALRCAVLCVRDGWWGRWSEGR